MDTKDGWLPAGGAARQEVRGDRTPALYLVTVRDCCCVPLAGRESCDYQSPPQPLRDAQALVALLMGRDHVDEIAPGEYAVPVAGGRRTIILETVS